MGENKVREKWERWWEKWEKRDWIARESEKKGREKWEKSERKAGEK